MVESQDIFWWNWIRNLGIKCTGAGGTKSMRFGLAYIYIQSGKTFWFYASFFFSQERYIMV